MSPGKSNRKRSRRSRASSSGTASSRRRGFVGIAFRLQTDRDPNGPQTYDAFYLRPTNGRAEDQERRNHSVQYISHPDWTWSRLRRETPSRYEAYVDLLPDAWTKIRIEVRGAQARLFVGSVRKGRRGVVDRAGHGGALSESRGDALARRDPTLERSLSPFFACLTEQTLREIETLLGLP